MDFFIKENITCDLFIKKYDKIDKEKMFFFNDKKGFNQNLIDVIFGLSSMYFFVIKLFDVIIGITLIRNDECNNNSLHKFVIKYYLQQQKSSQICYHSIEFHSREKSFD
eukprot:TRINITY_DN10143_c0_g1_i12.p7 TRINITY_DN10143_c0_g1~~TRINITY_DN10143_c0_g1_i12.p7  ORF type:complete len:109 (-),score=0.65 TRINITY_DN10143_c0_g1_i12:63-389(-)